ncbi:hypothetical protein BDV93DRAFT_506405 [Ceratobasidium sp. AG-I]|nr:hypothetical protein BDV93DRAFT_506405 [Ceratobasidium sp. AG-I]
MSRPSGATYSSKAKKDAFFSKKHKGCSCVCELGLLAHELFHSFLSLGYCLDEVGMCSFLRLAHRGILPKDQCLATVGICMSKLVLLDERKTFTDWRSDAISPTCSAPACLPPQPSVLLSTISTQPSQSALKNNQLVLPTRQAPLQPPALSAPSLQAPELAAGKPLGKGIGKSKSKGKGNGKAHALLPHLLRVL